MIKRLHIEAFKSISEISFDCKKLNLITGINSSGKSTLLQALLIAAQNSRSDSGINGRYINIGEFRDAKSFNVKAKEIRISVEDDIGQTFDLIFDETGVIKNSFYDKELNMFAEQGSFENIRYLSCNRIGAEDIYRKNFTENKDVGINGEYTIFCLDKYKSSNLPEELITYKSSYTLYSQVNHWLNYILGASVSTENIVGTDFVKCFYSIAEGKQIRPKNIGAGLSYLISILVLCLLSDKNDIIIIENPEIHLHPQAQSKVCEFLYFIAKSDRQLFIETHSDHVFNGIRVGIATGKMANEDVSVNFFNTDENNNTQNNVVEFGKRGRILNYTEGLFDQFDIDLNKMLDI